MNQPEALTALTDPENEPQFHFAEDDGEGLSPDEARAFLARVITPVGSSGQTVEGDNA